MNCLLVLLLESVEQFCELDVNTEKGAHNVLTMLVMGANVWNITCTVTTCSTLLSSLLASPAAFTQQ